VVSLALDTSTQLAGRSAPEGILYSGARDGLVCAWDLKLQMRRREAAKSSTDSRRSGGRWEAMTGWGDDAIDEEAEDGEDRIRSDGDVIGDVNSPRKKRRWADGSIPYEFQWETDLDVYHPGKVGVGIVCCGHDIHHTHYSQVNFDNAHKRTQIG
jgi:WD repeat-containing protein 48